MSKSIASIVFSYTTRWGFDFATSTRVARRLDVLVRRTSRLGVVWFYLVGHIGCPLYHGGLSKISTLSTQLSGGSTPIKTQGETALIQFRRLDCCRHGGGYLQCRPHLHRTIVHEIKSPSNDSKNKKAIWFAPISEEEIPALDVNCVAKYHFSTHTLYLSDLV